MRYRILLSILILAGLGACSDTDTGTPTDGAAPPWDTLSDVPTVDDATSSDTGQEDGSAAIDTATNDTADAVPTPDVIVQDQSMLDAEICLCPPSKHCDENDLCADDVCAQGVTTCADSTTQKVCNEDGSNFDLNPCLEGENCYLGECFVPLCDPAEPATCGDGP